MRRIFYCLVVVVLLTSCSHANISEQSDLPVINARLILEEPTPLLLSDIAESVEFLKLETRPDILVDGYMCTQFADSLLILYNMQSGVLIFDSKTGKYKHRISGFKESGPLEYDRIVTPLSIDDKGNMMISKGDNLGIWNYITGKFKYEVKLNTYEYGPMYFTNDSTLIIGNTMNPHPEATSTFDLLSLKDGSIVKKYGFYNEWDIKSYNKTSGEYATSVYNDTISKYWYKTDTIYGVSKNTMEIAPRYVLNLGDKLMPMDINKTTSPDYGNYICLTDFLENDRWLFMTFFYDGKSFLSFFDKINKSTHYIDNYTYEPEVNYGFQDDISGLNIKFYPTGMVSPDKAYTIFEADKFIKLIGEEKATEMGVKSSDSPILMIVKLKK